MDIVIRAMPPSIAAEPMRAYVPAATSSDHRNDQQRRQSLYCNDIHVTAVCYHTRVCKRARVDEMESVPDETAECGAGQQHREKTMI